MVEHADLARLHFLSQTIDVLVIAVIGGLYRLEGAWVGAVVVTMLDNWLRGVDLIGNRFNTVIGAIFLAIVLISPGANGNLGLAHEQLQSRFARDGSPEETEVIPLTQDAHPPRSTHRPLAQGGSHARQPALAIPPGTAGTAR